MRLLFVSANRYRYVASMPLGLASVIAQIDASRHEIEALDLMFSETPEDDLRSALLDLDPDLIGISIRNIDNQRRVNNEYFLPDAKRIVELCRSHSEATIVLGGAAFTTTPIAVFDYLEPDLGIAGEGELVFSELLERLEQGDDHTDLPGLVWRGGDGIRMNPCKLVEDLDSLEPPRRDLFDNQRYMEEGGSGNIVIKQGCAFQCFYCDAPYLVGAHWRMRSPESVADELESMERDLHLETTFFSDSIFNCPVDHAREVCRSIIRRGLSIKWTCLASPAFADRELLELMRDAGCTMVVLGCDTGSERMLQALNKGYAKQTVIDAARTLEELKLDYALPLLLGGPGEDEQTVRETVEFLSDRSPASAAFYVGIRVLPNSPLVDTAKREGVISARDPLMEPRFYISPKIRDWVDDYLADLCADNPGWVVRV